MLNIALIGKTGSGKSTLAASLAEEFGLEIISSNILTEYVNARCDGWQIVEKCMAVGEFIPRDIMTKILEAAVDKIKGGCIRDNVVVAEHLKVFEKYRKIDIAFHLEVSDEIAWQRVNSRSREKDPIVHFKNRNEVFNKNFAELKDAFGERMITIDAGQSISEVHKQCADIIRKRRGFN